MSCWFGGRLYNRFSGEVPEYIPLSGTHLRQTLELIGLTAPAFIVPSGSYELRMNYVPCAMEALAPQIAHQN